MQAVKFVVKLYDLPSEEGVITAFDSFGPNLFIGTDRGNILKFLMEDASPSAGDAAVNNASTSSRSRSTSAVADASSIFTTHVGSLAVSEQPKKRIARVQHSRTHSLLFVLCSKQLLVVDSINLKVLTRVCEGIGTFHVSSVKVVAQRPAIGSGGGLGAADAAPSSVDGDAAGSPLLRQASVHVITAAQKYGRGVGVYELDSPHEAQSSADVTVKLNQELVLPEPVQGIVELNGMICVGLRREYSMLSLKDGDARSILALNNRTPLIAMGDGEVFLRLQQSVFAVSMKAMPTAGQSVKRTIHFEYEPQCIIFRHPFLFAFSDNCCDVFSLYDDEVVERLPLPGVQFGSKFGSGDTIYAASGNKLWMMRIHSLRSQLAGLIHRYKVSDAFHLLSFQKRSSPQFALIERELNVMAGFAHLYHGKASDAMHHFAGLIDVRELLRHLPDLCPLPVQLRLSVGDNRPDHTDTGRSIGDTAAEPQEGQRIQIVRALLDAQIRAVEDGRAAQSGCWHTPDAEDQHMRGWLISSPYNRIGIRSDDNLEATVSHSPMMGRRKSSKAVVGCTIEELWKQAFYELPEVDSQQQKLQRAPSTKKGGEDEATVRPPVRVAPDLGIVTEEEFTAACRHELKRHLGCYLTSTLSTSCRDQRRASEYALLVLALQSKNYSGAYHLVDCGCALNLQDCYWLLHDAEEHRLLALLLQRRGLMDEALELYETSLRVDSFIPPRNPPAGHRGGGGGGRWLTETAEARIRAILCEHDKSVTSVPMRVRDANVTRTLTSVGGASCPPVAAADAWRHTLDEIMVALDHMDTTQLEALLREDPSRIDARDKDGNTLMMLAAAYLFLSPIPEPILGVMAFLVDAGCLLTEVNNNGEDLIALSERLFSPTYQLFFLSFLTSHCTVRAQSSKYAQDESFSEFALLPGCDPSVWKALGSWQGYVVNRGPTAT